MIEISKRAKRCRESPTLAITQKANSMKASGKDVVSFAAGEPDFEPPEITQKAAIEAIGAPGSGKYVSSSGISKLKEEIANKFRKDNGIEYSISDISVNNGAKSSLHNILQAIVDEGDEVIVPRPYWVSYPEMVGLAGGTAVFADTDKEFRLNSESIEKAIGPKTKAIILNSPNNPSGAVISETELRKIASLAVERGIYVISDEIYEKIYYGKKPVSIASLGPQIKEITFTVNGMSKSHAIPGWRLGYVAGPAKEMKALNRIQSQSSGNVCSIVQSSAAISLNHADDFIRGAVAEFRRRRDFLVAELNKIPGMNCALPDGAFYLFPKIPISDDWEFANRLLEEKLVAVVPGTEFGTPGHVRISYATSMENIRKGAQRIREFCAGL